MKVGKWRRVDLKQALRELDDQELRVWLSLHTLDALQLHEGKKITAKRLGRVSLRSELNRLELKGYIEIMAGENRTQCISLALRLDVSEGMFVRSPNFR